MIIKVFLLLLLLWSVDGVKRFRPAQTDNNDVSGSGSNEDDKCMHMSNDDEDIAINCSAVDQFNAYFSDSGSDEDNAPCCSSGNYTFYSIFDLLNNVTSNTIINISTDAVLPSNVTLEGLRNITIIGQGNPTVNCNDIGSVKFVSCNNVTIEGVNWERCGSVKKSGMEFSNTSNIAIQSCSFHYSTGKTVSLLKVSGNVSINNCQFTHNKHRKGHGAAIYYTSSHKQSTRLVINNCDFTLNGPVRSVVYIDNSNSTVDISLLQNSSFTQNQGVSIYIYNTTLILNNIVSFKDNKATDGGAICSRNSIIKFDDKCNVSFYNNSAKYNGGAIYQTYSKILFKLNAAVRFAKNTALKQINFETGLGGAIYSTQSSLISFEDQSVVTFSNNKALQGGALYVDNTDISFYGNNSKQTNNTSGSRAEAPCTVDDSVMSCSDTSTVTFSGNIAKYKGGAIRAIDCNITFYGHSTVTFRRNHAGTEGGAIEFRVIDGISDMLFGENSTVLFTENSAWYYGGAVSVHYYIHYKYFLINSLSKIKFISFNDHSTVIFSNNTVTNEGQGGAIAMNVFRGLVSFAGRSIVVFSNNTAQRGGALYCQGNVYKLIFQGNTNVTFTNNRAKEGGAVYCSVPSGIIFTGSAVVNAYNNEALQSGGAILLSHKSTIWCTGRSTTYFNNNLARQHGGAIHFIETARIIFGENCTAEFCNNTASLSGGAISSLDNCTIWFTGKSQAYFNSNLARQHGGAISSVLNAMIAFNETCSVMFINNTAIQQGGAVYLFDNSTITFEDSCNVSYYNNAALLQGGAVYFALQSNISFKENSNITFKANNAIISGGALYTFSNNPVYFENNCTVLFYDNMVRKDGGAIHFVNTSLHFCGSSSVTFKRNTALQQGGALNLFYNSSVVFQNESNVTFTHNTAMQHGGAVYVHDNSSVSFVGSTKVVFHHNVAERDGGALYSYDHCNITIGQYSEVLFVSNSAMQFGGAMYCDHHSYVTLKGHIIFTSNTAEHGGAVCVSQSFVKFANNSIVMLNKNRAGQNGGGLYFNDQCDVNIDHDSSIEFVNNSAHRFGGALYSQVNPTGLSKLKLNSSEISFIDNRALSGNSVYLDIPSSCDEACLKNSIVGVNKVTLKHGPLADYIQTPPSKLVLCNPAVCIDDDNGTDCETYFIDNIMLGQEIITDACVLDYYDKHADETQFIVDSNYKNPIINGSNSVLISCTQLQGISITGFKISDAINFSMNLTSHAGSKSDLKTISIKLIIGLSPCHPGFYYDNKRCVCYDDDNDIITCSGSTSFIRRGYWFGVVNDKSTVTVCPKNYCNFTCCEVTNGFYQLSPARINQCSSHRSGTACGSCKEGYTLSFDSDKCVSVDKCTKGQTVMVVTLSMIYWIVIVILVFIMTYYHVGIGYLYSITYYYSMLDILLGHTLHQSKGLFTAVSIMSSIVKVTPQFLGQLCFVEDMSGIDQQFIHYTHPLAVSIIIVIICQAARISYKFSSFISRGIIRTVCFLLLLSYTSVATTSLLLLRSLTFDNMDKIYTYLSPDIEYCHGRHLTYFIVAVLCTLVIVIGLPLLLLLEPFLKCKISFTRMKPLLDQFQGCYKDRYRCFAAYYMICRLVIIIIIISIPSSNVLSQFLLIFSSVILAFIPIYLKPYDHKILNKFDGLILLLVVLATLIPLADSVSQQLSTATIIIVMILPLIFFIALELIVHKETIKTIVTKITANFTAKSFPTTNNNNDIPMGDIGLVIDNNLRRNATICEIPSNTSDDVTHYRESFMEVMDQIED